MTDPVAAAHVTADSRARRAWLAALGVPVAIALALWSLDGGLLAVRGLALAALLPALVVTFPLAVACGVVCGLLSAALCALAWLDVDPQQPSIGSRVRGWLLAGDRAVHADRIALSLATLLVTAFGGYVAYRVTYGIVIDIARPHHVALAVLAAHLVIGVLGVVFVVPTRAGLRVIVRRLQAVPRVGWLLSSVWRSLVVMVAVAVGVAIWFSVRQRFAMSYLPWESIGQVTAAVLIGVGLHYGHARTSRMVRRMVAAALALGSVAAVVIVSAWGEQANGARIVAEERTLSGAAGYRVLRALIDYDDDGHLNVLGGGDCAPHDASIHPGATDLPENRIDEDCDGEDLTSRIIDSPSGYRFDVPKQWPERPPIVLITVDAFAANRMAAFGNTDRVTPYIDAFAESAAMFRACFAQGPSTRLSFPSMFTSRWDSQIAQRLEGKHPYPIEASELMLAEVLQQAGYETAAIVSDAYFDPGHWKGITDGFNVVDTSSYRRHPLTHNASVVTDAALAELAKPRKRPLFLWVHYYDAHSPHTQPEGVPRRGVKLADVYDAELSLVDREVGRLLARLDRGPASQPLVVLTADHGIDFDATHHAKFNYGYDLYTSVLHVPLIIRVPGAPRARYEHLVSTMDIAPTVANLLRLKVRLPFRGVSLVRELSSGFATESRRLIHEFYIFERYWRDEDPLEKIGLRTERFNLIHDRTRGVYELYDWRADYYEADDLSADPEFTDVFRDLRKQLAFFTYSLHRRPAPVPGQPVRHR